MGGNSGRRGPRRLRRYAVTSLVLGLLAALLVAVPAGATGGHGRSAPAVRIFARTNDDGRAGRADPGDTGGISAEYDRWGHRSSDDPTELGLDPNRISSDVARCKAIRIDKQTMRVRIQNAYPGYVCSFTVVTVNRAGAKLVLDDILIDVDPGLELEEIDGPAPGDVLKRRRSLHGAYGVTVLQEAPQGETLEFDIEFSFVRRHWRPPPKCCHHCWR